jgi:hypothetical protein
MVCGIGLPWAVKLHIINAWVIIGFFPFTRLVHVIVAPFPYLWRKPEIVRWYGVRRVNPLWMKHKTAANARTASVSGTRG